MPVTSYSRTPSDNNSSPPDGWPENMAAASVNNCARQLMTDIVNEAGKGSARVLASVSGTNTITASMAPDLDAYAAGMIVVFTPAGNNTGATTLNIDTLGALDVQKYDGEALVAGDLVSGIPAILVLDSGADDWNLLNPQSLRTTAPNTSAEEFGFKGLPQQSQVANYTLVLADAGKHVVMNGSSITLTIPANASVAFPIGTSLAIFNSNATDLSIAITTDSMILAGTSSTGTRTLVQHGLASILKIDTAVWAISGTGLS
jgi:hypothetical protein